jgi:hypothetical protein
MLNGMKFKVTDIRDGAVYFTYDKSDTSSMIMYGSGIMSFNEFEKHFEIVKEESVKTNTVREWTEWKDLNLNQMIDDICGVTESCCEYCPCTTMCDIDKNIAYAVYRTNAKKTEIRCVLNDGTMIKSYAACHKVDEFNLKIGLEVALARLSVKLAEHNFKKYVDSIE